MRNRFLLFLLVLLPAATAPARAESLPDTLNDREFWSLVTELSESSGMFPQQFMSNEDSFQSVIPRLKDTARKNGVYVGVGSEQNFTYIAAVQPEIAFILDIRRDNMIEHLMYKALFELSNDRADFLSRLFSRKRPESAGSGMSAKALFDAFQTTEPDAALYEQNLRAVTDRLAVTHKFELNDADRSSLARIMNTIRLAGPYSLKGFGDTSNPTYAQLMSTTDPAGTNQSYLASEDNFQIVRKLELRNLVVPLVGDFAGDKAIAGIGRYLKQHDAPIDVFYVSNVERYLFDQFDHGRQFYANVGTLPLNNSSTFIRSVTTDISRRLGIQLPDGKEKWRSFLFPIQDCVGRIADGRIRTYKDLFDGAR
jgi:hypothetical protein